MNTSPFHIRSVSEPTYYRPIRQLRYIRPYLDFTTACTIAIPPSSTPKLITV